MAIFATYVFVDPVNNVLDAEKIFVTLALINVLGFPMTLLPLGVSNIIQVSRVTYVKYITNFVKSRSIFWLYPSLLVDCSGDHFCTV